MTIHVLDLTSTLDFAHASCSCGQFNEEFRGDRVKTQARQAHAAHERQANRMGLQPIAGTAPTWLDPDSGIITNEAGDVIGRKMPNLTSFVDAHVEPTDRRTGHEIEEDQIQASNLRRHRILCALFLSGFVDGLTGDQLRQMTLAIDHGLDNPGFDESAPEPSVWTGR